MLDALAESYHLICVNYDGFDGSDLIFPDMITVTEKIEQYIGEHYDGRIDGAIGSSLGSSFVGQLIQRQNVHLDHGIFGSPDLDRSGKFSAWLQSKLVVPLLTFTKGEKKKAKAREKIKNFFEMSDETADKFMACFEKFSPESIKNEYYNIDMLDVIAVRNELFPAGERERNIACDLNDFSWMDEIDPKNGAVFFAAGVFYYFKTEESAVYFVTDDGTDGKLNV